MYNTRIVDDSNIQEAYVAAEALNKFYSENKYLELSQISKGDGLKIGVIDSGIDMLHDDLSSRFMPGYNAFTGEEEGYKDVNGHGTYSMGLIASRNFGLLPNAEFYPIRVCSDTGTINLSAITKAIKWCIEKDIDIILIAITTETNYIELHEAIKEAHKARIVIICSASNDKGIVGYPAKYPETLAVSGIDFDGTIPDFASNQENIDMAMPCVDILSTYYYNRYAISSGNSVAAALAVNYVGLLQSLRKKQNNCRLTVEQLKYFIQTNSVPIDDVEYGVPTFNKFSQYGYSFNRL